MPIFALLHVKYSKATHYVHSTRKIYDRIGNYTIHTITKTRIATHGHGIWQRDFVNDPLAASDFALDEMKFILYPNPTAGDLTIETNLNHSFENATLEIFTVLGTKVVEIVINDISIGTNKFKYNASELSAGTYLVLMSSNGSSSSKLLVVK